MINWSNLKNYFKDLLPDNVQQLISPLKVRTAFGALMDAFEAAVQFAVSTPTQRSIVVLFSTARSWPITLSSAQNTISHVAHTSISKRTLIMGEDFVINGQGTNRTFAITNLTFDDLVPGEKIIYTENVRGGLVSLKLPVFGVITVGGVKKVAWKQEGEADAAYQVYGDMPSPYDTADIKHQGGALSTLVTRLEGRQATYALVNVTDGYQLTHHKNTTTFLAFFLTSDGKMDLNITATAVDSNTLKINIPMGDPAFSGILFLLSAV